MLLLDIIFLSKIDYILSTSEFDNTLEIKLDVTGKYFVINV